MSARPSSATAAEISPGRTLRRRHALECRLGDYVIRGMDPDFRELLYRAGLAIDAAGIGWTIRSAFRDDYRQGLASGYKARIDNSLHGGSAATGGYGHGCAVDIADPDSKSDTLWKWLDANGAQLGLQRPFPGYRSGPRPAARGMARAGGSGAP